MANPQPPELSSRPSTAEPDGPVPEDNRPGHHPPQEQDKPVARFRQRAAEVAQAAHRRQGGAHPMELSIGESTFRGLTAGPVSGELVILLHGFPQTSAAWTAPMAALADEGLRSWGPDQRGYSPGARRGGPAQYRLDRLVGDVLDMAAKLDSRRFHLVGHDWGGVVAWALAAAHPDRLLSLSVVSTPHPRALATSALRSAQVIRSGYVGFFMLPVLPELVLGSGNGAVMRQMLTRSGLPAERADEYARAMTEDGALSGALNWYRALRPGLARVGPVEVPTLYVWGQGDPALGPAAARATARYVRAPYRFEVLAEAGHWIPETRPEELSRLLVDHLGAKAGQSRAS